MKILLDMQGAQCQSRHRGIGRYSLDLARAFAPLAAGPHDLQFAFNAQLDDATDTVIATLWPHADASRRHLIKSLRHVAAHVAGNDVRRRAAEMLMRHALEQARPDVIWYSSMIEGYVDDAVIPETAIRGARSVATLYDLIPLHDPQTYLGHPRVKAWYDAKLKALARCDLLLAISDWVREDAITRLNLDPSRVVTIGGGVDSRFRPPADRASLASRTRNEHGISRPYVLYNGGFDARKNVPVLIHAYAALPADIRDRHQLVIVGRVSTEQRAALDVAVRHSGLDHSSVVFAGFVPDDALVDLYGCCELFVFPSTLEGFGLPPLEAMACGAPVIASHAASLPEVVGRRDALFDPSKPEAMAARMLDVLRHPARADELRRHSKEQSAKFTWEAVARRALQAIESLEMPSSQSALPETRTVGKPSLQCLHATPTPAWVDALTSHYEVNVQQLPADLPQAATPLSDLLNVSERLLYITTPEGAWQLAPWLQAWPGAVVITPGAAHVTPTDDMSLRYRAGGYASCLEPHAQHLRLQPDGCLGVFISPHPSAAAPDVGPGLPIAELPQDDQASALATQLEAWLTASPCARETRFLDELARTVGTALGENELAAAGDAIVSARPRSSTTQWLIDVTHIARNDIGTGVQRVVRSILLQWLQTPPPGVRVEPIAFADGHYRYARRYALELLGIQGNFLQDDFVEVASGDIYVGLDWSAETMVAIEPLLRHWHRQGVGMHFVVHDLLPVSLPEAFHPFARNLFIDWLRRVCILADGLHCVSSATASDLAKWLRQGVLPYQFGKPPLVSAFHLGVETTVSHTHADLAAPLAEALSMRPTLLMVGTLEPRKGHVQALDAVERLWAQEHDVNLVIVGHHGWMVEALVKRLQNHSELQRRLFWLSDADDHALEALYGQASALLAPSIGEGYGLPLVEAAHRDLPVIARDLPVFREVMGDYPHYFRASTSAELAEVLAAWLKSPLPPGQPSAWPSWRQSATALSAAIRRPASSGGVQTVV